MTRKHKHLFRRAEKNFGVQSQILGPRENLKKTFFLEKNTQKLHVTQIVEIEK